MTTIDAPAAPIEIQKEDEEDLREENNEIIINDNINKTNALRRITNNINIYNSIEENSLIDIKNKID